MSYHEVTGIPPAQIPRAMFKLTSSSSRKIIDAEGEFRRLEGIERLVQDPRQRVEAFKQLHGREPSVVDVVDLLDRPEQTIPRFMDQCREAMRNAVKSIIPVLESANIGTANDVEKLADKLQTEHVQACVTYGIMPDTVSYVGGLRESATRLRNPISPHSGASPRELARDYFSQ
jgi:hypothetical protein